MRVGSWKSCGIEFSIKDYCKICKKPNWFICKDCEKITEQQTHSTCIEILSVQ